MISYVIITPAHNEESFIEKTIQSVINQTILPTKWVVINDGSTDRTAEIVQRYCSKYAFLKLVGLQRSSGRHFANKVAAFNRGLTEVLSLDFEFIGNLDADVSLKPNYYANILSRFGLDPKLGIAGGIVFTKIGNGFTTDDETLDSVAGAIQLFRRSCFKEIGGYITLPYGGIDAAAEITARMKGWKVKKFPENRVFEHRRTGTAVARPVAARLNEGRRFHSLGYGALFYFLRCISRLTDRPMILGSTAALAGYLMSIMRRRPIALPKEAVVYLRAEQRDKLVRSMKLQFLRGAMQ